MNEDQLKAILARNPAITVERDDEDKPTRLCYVTGSSDKRRNHPIPEVHEDSSQVPPPEPERREAHALDEVVQGEETRQTRPIIRFIFYRTRLLDADAVHAGAKDLLDGLVEAGLIAGDREDQIDFDARQVKVSYKKDERTEIEITLP